MELSSFSRLNGLLMLQSNGDVGLITEQKTFAADAEISEGFRGYSIDFLKEYAANPDDYRFCVGLLYQSLQPKPWGTETLLLSDATVRTLYPVSGAFRDQLTSFQKKKRENSIYYGMELLLEYALKDAPNIPIYMPILYDGGTTLGQHKTVPPDVLSEESPNTPVMEVLNFIGPVAASRRNLDAFIALKRRVYNSLIDKDARRSIERKLVDSMRSKTGNMQLPSAAAAASMTSLSPTDLKTLNPDRNSSRWYIPSLHSPSCEKLAKFLNQPREYTSADQIRQFARFKNIAVNQQRLLAACLPIYTATPGHLLLDRDTTDAWNLYLLEGDIELTAADGAKRIITGGTENATNSVAALKPRKFTVTALTRARFLWIHEDIINEVQKREPGSKFELTN